jgi:CBS domain-containing protein
VTQRLEGVTVADIMDADPVTIPDSIRADQAWEDFFLRYHGWPWFAVVAGDGRFVGLAHREAVEHAARVRPDAPMREVAVPGDQVRDDATLEALLGSEPLRRLGALMAVDADGRLRGVVTLDQVTRALQARLAPS